MDVRSSVDVFTSASACRMAAGIDPVDHLLAPAPGAHSAKVATGFAVRVRASDYSKASSGG
jgi:hypothetical protein